jgi:AsmA protein
MQRLQVNFEDLKLENLKGNMTINKGQLALKNSTFDVIGANVNGCCLWKSIARKSLF